MARVPVIVNIGVLRAIFRVPGPQRAVIMVSNADFAWTVCMCNLCKRRRPRFLQCGWDV
jgi:hypothetical protein